MDKKLAVQYAVQCLETLAHSPTGKLTTQDISGQSGVPFALCQKVMSRMEYAGIVALGPDDRYGMQKPLEEITALAIVQACWNYSPHLPKFKILYARHKRQLKATLKAVSSAHSAGAYPGEAAE